MELLLAILSSLSVFLRGFIVFAIIPIFFGFIFWCLIIQLKIYKIIELLLFYVLHLCIMWKLVIYLELRFVNSGHSSFGICTVAFMANTMFIGLMCLLHGTGQPANPE